MRFTLTVRKTFSIGLILSSSTFFLTILQNQKTEFLTITLNLYKKLVRYKSLLINIKIHPREQMSYS